jgi:hypothetical protein
MSNPDSKKKPNAEPAGAPAGDAGSVPASGSENLNPGSTIEPPPANTDGAQAGPETALQEPADQAAAAAPLAAAAPVLGSAPPKPSEPVLTELQSAALALKGDGTPVSRAAALGWVVGKKVWITATRSYQVCPMSHVAFQPGTPVRTVLTPWMIAQVDKEVPLLGPIPKEDDDEDGL